MNDFPVLDPIPEQAPLDGKFLFPFVRVMSSSDARFFVLNPCLWRVLLFVVFFLPDVDFDFDVDSIPVMDEPTFPAPSAQAAPEASASQAVVPPVLAVIVLPAPPVPPAASEVPSVEKDPAAATSAQVGVSPTSISVDTLLEDSIVEGFKETLAKASGIELRLRELVSDAGMMKDQMHVSTYVSPLSDGCILLYLRVVLMGSQ